ncbi:MAG TPA: START domain-containing protein [Chitinophagaceae bacterium]|nr:START domain-containing protein [Chitinophagaceae bacterium]
MNWNRLFLTGAILFFISGAVAGQTDWELKLDKENIRVYTKNMDNSALKSVKTVCSINTSLTTLTAVLLDINNSIDWVYATKKITLLKQISPGELIYYSELEIPWPVNNRDFIVGLTVLQDEKTKMITVLGTNKPAYLPAYKDIVRIQQSYSKWMITPLQNGQVKIEYELRVDPGGKVPVWLVNMFATKGPFETFKKLREQVKKPVYSHISLPFIKD